MAFGFPPKHSHSFPIEEGEETLFLTQAVESADQLGWEISFLNKKGFIAHSKFSMASWSEQIDLTIGEKESVLISRCTGNQLFDWGKNKKNIESFIEQYNQLDRQFSQGELAGKSQALWNRFSAEGINAPEPGNQKNSLSSFFSVFIPTQDYFITPILLALNLFIFVLMAVAGVGIFSPDGQSLVDWGANFRPSTMQGEWWRLLTACFIHIGLVHLLLNLYALVYIGILLEPYLKKSRFLAVYIGTGVIASTCSLWWHEYTVSAGASGAIFGLYGVFLALLTTNILHESVKKSFLTSTAIFVVYNLLNGLKPDSGVDNAAHIGGLLSGLVMGYCMVPSLKKTDHVNLKIITVSALAVLTIVCSFLFYRTIPNDYATYDLEMARFSDLEEKALTVFNLPENAAKDELIKAISEDGLPGWNENLHIIAGIEKLNLPLTLKTRNGQLKKYCELRIKHYELLYKALIEDSDIYDNELKASNEAIGKVIKDLSGQ